MAHPLAPCSSWKRILLASLTAAVPFTALEARARADACGSGSDAGSGLRTAPGCPSSPTQRPLAAASVLLAQAPAGAETFIAADSFNRFTTNSSGTISTSRDTVIGRNSGTVEIITKNSGHPIYFDESGNSKTVNIVTESVYGLSRRGAYPMSVFYANIVHGSYDLNVANTLSGNVTTLSGNNGDNILVGRKNGSSLYGSGGDDTLYIYGSGFADGGPGNDTYILLPPIQETALVASTALAGILPMQTESIPISAAEGNGQPLAQGRKIGTLPRISVESTDAVYLPEVFPEDTDFRTIFYENQGFNEIRNRLSELQPGAYLVLTRRNRDYLATAVTVANGSSRAKDVAIVEISDGRSRGIEKIFSKGKGPRGSR